MKIAFIGQKGIPAKFIGVERHVEELASEIAKNGHEVFVYVRNNYTGKKINEYRGVKLIHLPSVATKNLDAISHTFLASIHALFQDYDVVHYQAIGPSILSWIVKLLKKKTVVVSTFHCQDYCSQKQNWFTKKILLLSEWVSCNVPDKTIVVSKSLEEYVIDKYGIDPEVIYSGIRIEEDFNWKILEKWKLQKNKYFIYVGKLIKDNGVHHLITAFKRLDREGKVPDDFKLVVVGDGFYTDDYVNELKELANNNDNIIFTGNLMGIELRTIFAGAHLFVQPSELEGLSIATLEAMSLGVPILASDIKENTDVVENVGEIFKTNDVADLKDKLNQSINREMGANPNIEAAKRMVKVKYNWESVSQKTISLYIRLLCEKKINALQCSHQNK